VNGRPTAAKKKPGPLSRPGFSFEDGVAVTYFRVRKRHTIIGANSFHGPVRDGKAWFQAAVARHQENYSETQLWIMTATKRMTTHRSVRSHENKKARHVSRSVAG
jgi:hypothetical protein